MTDKQHQQWKKDLEELKRLRDFVKYVSSIDSVVVSDPDNENPLSMGELQHDATQALKGE